VLQTVNGLMIFALPMTGPLSLLPLGFSPLEWRRLDDVLGYISTSLAFAGFNRTVAQKVLPCPS
jgi:hypothetical protein